MAKLAFLGLGVMGFPMAGHLAKAGHDLCVYNRSPAKAQAWTEQFGGRSAATPAQAAQGADLVLSCVGNDGDLRAVMLGETGAFKALRPGMLVVDHTTVSAAVSRDLAGIAAQAGAAYLDAPVSGGQAGAQAGQLTIMVGGEASSFAEAEPILAVYAKRVGLMGPVGAGQLTKMVNQVAIAGILQGLAEAVQFAKAAGLDADQVFDVIGKGAAQSWQMDNRARTMAKGEFDFGFAVDWMRKDLAIVLDEAKAMRLSMPLTALVDQFYADVQRLGGGRQDTSSLVRRFLG
jgi:3-hydroxyisobutyrate dehydrogenase-like beta-hydroxyacid dehydrogenase